MINPMRRSALAAMMALAMLPGDMLPRMKEKPVKKCLKCGNPHTHNNAFCSPECCKTYKEMKRGKI